MRITEAQLAPYRQKIKRGPHDQNEEMPFTGMSASRLGTTVSQELFSYSHHLLEGQLNSRPEHGGGDFLELAIFLAFTESVPPLANDLEWWAIDHQAGGHATCCFSFIGTRLTPNPDLYQMLRQIARDRWYAKSGNLYTGRVSARYICEYSGDLNKIGLDCDFSYPHLMESVYPIDAIQDNLDRIALDAPRLNSLGRGFHGPYGKRTNRNLIIVAITENSD